VPTNLTLSQRAMIIFPGFCVMTRPFSVGEGLGKQESGEPLSSKQPIGFPEEADPISPAIAGKFITLP
jgi:hypothetical protein